MYQVNEAYISGETDARHRGSMWPVQILKGIPKLSFLLKKRVMNLPAVWLAQAQSISLMILTYCVHCSADPSQALFHTCNEMSVWFTPSRTHNALDEVRILPVSHSQSCAGYQKYVITSTLLLEKRHFSQYNQDFPGPLLWNLCFGSICSLFRLWVLW